MVAGHHSERRSRSAGSLDESFQPLASLLIVKGGDGSFSTASILDGLMFMSRTARALRLPAVVNMSLGDYTTNFNTVPGGARPAVFDELDRLGIATIELEQGSVGLVAAALALLVAARIAQALRPRPPGSGPRHAAEGRPDRARAGGPTPIPVEISGTYARRRFASQLLMGLGVICSAVSVVHTWGWADIPGGMITFVMGPNLLLAGWMLLNAARYAEGERRREAHRRSSPQRSAGV